MKTDVSKSATAEAVGHSEPKALNMMPSTPEQRGENVPTHGAVPERVIAPRRVRNCRITDPEILTSQQAIENWQKPDRDSFLVLIEWHEIQLLLLKNSIPRIFKNIYCYRCHPQNKVYVYAKNAQQAEARLIVKMTASYQDSWNRAVPRVDVFDDPFEAAVSCGSSLLSLLGQDEAVELIRDYQEHEASKPVDVDRPKNLPNTALTVDVADYLYGLRRQGLKV